MNYTMTSISISSAAIKVKFSCIIKCSVVGNMRERKIDLERTEIKQEREREMKIDKAKRERDMNKGREIERKTVSKLRDRDLLTENEIKEERER